MPDKPPRHVPPFLTAHGRLLEALLAGLVVYVLLAFVPPRAATGPLRVAMAWDVTAVAYLALSIRMMWRGDLESIRARAKAVDIGIVEIVTIVVLVGLFSVFAVAGVLAEARERRVVLGVGINVNIPEEQLPQEVDVPATSLLVETGREIDRAELLVEVLERLERRYDAWVTSSPA